MKTINIARDFSKYPGGRYRTDGEWSGERFRDDVLVPALIEHTFVRVEMDGTLGYGSSFLEECFGGLVRVHKMTPASLMARLVLISKNCTSSAEAIQYITDAFAHAAASEMFKQWRPINESQNGIDFEIWLGVGQGEKAPRG